MNPDEIEAEEIATTHTLVSDMYTVEKNIAANGRLFSALVFAANLAAFGLGHGAIYAQLAILAAAPVGLSCIIDQLPVGKLRHAATLFSYALSAFVALAFLISIG